MNFAKGRMPALEATSEKEAVLCTRLRTVPPELSVKWANHDGAVVALELVGDNLTVINWLNGTAICKGSRYIPWVDKLRVALYKAWCMDLVAPRQRHCNWSRHVYREFNKSANALATRGILSLQSVLEMFEVPAGTPTCLGAHFDGGQRESRAASGWLLRGRWGENADWRDVAHASTYIGSETSTFAELFAATEASSAALNFIRTGRLEGDSVGRPMNIL